MEPSNQPLISVVIPVYNAEKYIAETINSILSQTHTNLEIVAVDDGSKDSSVELLKTFGEKVRVIEQSNSGPAAARNRGVQEARGEWIAFIDSDDIWLPEKLEKQLAYTAPKYQWSYTDCVFMGGVNDGRRDSEFSVKHEGQILKHLVERNFIGTSSILIRRDLYLDEGGFDEKLKSIEDWEFWVRIAAREAVGFINEAFVKYRIHPSSSSRGTRSTLPNHIQVIERIFAKDGPAKDFRHLLNTSKATSYGICTEIAEEEGDYSFALRCAFNAARHQPANIRRWVRFAKAIVKWGLYSFRGARQPSAI